MAEESGLSHWADILIIVIYFLFVLAVGIWSILKRNRGNVEGYFLAGRTMPWFAVGASIFGSNIGSEHFIGLAGAGASSGIVLVLFEWIPAMIIQALSWFFLPVFVSAGVYTLPEYMEKRFGSRKIRLYLSVLALLLHILTRLSIAIFAGAVYIQFAMKWNMYPSIIGLLIITSIFTMFGGLSAVMYTDTAQSLIIIVGAFVVMGKGLYEIGGYNNLESAYQAAKPSHFQPNSTCGMPRPDAFHVLRDSQSDFPWPSMILQCGISSAWYWICDQIMVQRCLAARNISHAKGGTLLGGFLKVLPLFIMIIPGMIARILYTDDVACVDPDVCTRVCDNPAGCSNIAYPMLVFKLLPNGARGLLMAVMLSAIVTSLTSIFNSSSTVFTMDIWRRIRSDAKQRELLIVGRGYIVLLCILTILWIPVVKAAQGGQLFTYLVVVEGFIAAPLPILFGLAVFWDRTTEQGAFYGIVITHAIGIVRLILEVVFPVPACGELDTRPHFLSKVHSFYYSEMLMVIQLTLTVVVSLCTKSRTPEQLQGTTWSKRLRPTDSGIGKPYLDECATGNEYTLSLQESPETEEAEVPSPELEKETEQNSCILRLCNQIFGLSSTNEKQAVEISLISRMKFLRESNKTVKSLTNSLAILLIATMSFLIGFYK